MDVCKEHVHMINKLATGNSEFTKAEQETLAVIAYKQPVKQSVIVNIRGNKAYEHIKKFLENELVVGKRVGHTKELRLSEDFYEYFHLRNRLAISDDHRNSESSEEFRDIRNKKLERINDESLANNISSEDSERLSEEIGVSNEKPIIFKEQIGDERSLIDKQKDTDKDKNIEEDDEEDSREEEESKEENKIEEE